MSWVAVGTTAASVVSSAAESNKAPEPPDLSDQTMAAEEIAQINQDLAQMEQAWAQDTREQNRLVMEDVLGISLPAAEQALETGEEFQQRFEDVFQPLEEELVSEARDYASPERIQREQAAAMADTAQAIDRQRIEALRRLEGYGVDPSQTRNQALDVGVRLERAAQQVGAANQARQRVEDTGRALRGQAIELGQRYPGMALQQTGQALQAGGQALGQQLQTAASGMQLGQAALPFYDTSLSGLRTSGELATGQFGGAMQSAQARNQQQADLFQGLGSFGVYAADQFGGSADQLSPVQSSGMRMMEPMPNFADGGPMVALPGTDNEGAIVDPTGRSNGSGIDDKTPIMASEGEYIIPADVVRVKGTEFFDKLVEKYHTPAAQQRGRQAAMPAPAVGANNG